GGQPWDSAARRSGFGVGPVATGPAWAQGPCAAPAPPSGRGPGRGCAASSRGRACVDGSWVVLVKNLHTLAAKADAVVPGDLGAQLLAAADFEVHDGPKYLNPKVHPRRTPP
nr:hypothetical protein [Tanacetum cinerariifolium]